MDISINEDIDFYFTDNGDIATTLNLHPSILISLFANATKEPILEDEAGSKIYELDIAKITTETLTYLRYYSKSALNWITELQLAENINSNVLVNYPNIELQLEINNFKISNKETENYVFKL